ncbi:MAG: group II intron reverse transcriptase/maturase, partial [Chloroflexi bacterium]|nr:group II intron reverse transcriptase/maturase [Chloroflexota bacterium]
MTGIKMIFTPRYTESWETIPWTKCHRLVFRLQRRIYRAASRGDFKRVHSLQRLLLRSWSARCLAVRQVSQDNRGKRTPGVDGVASLTIRERCRMVDQLKDLDSDPDAIRRIYIEKPQSTELRPLGIPTMFDRARQALVKLVLEPEWEAQFEPNVYGFRPGRCQHDAIQSIFNFVRLKPKWCWDADIEKCFDKIAHAPLLAKLNTFPRLNKLIRGWLKAGVVDNGETLYPEAGTPQGGVISPLLMNIALHGLEAYLVRMCPHRNKPGVIRFADDLVIIHEDLDTLRLLISLAETWLADMGLRFKPSKSRIVHTLHEHQGQHPGFDFLGFNVRQYPVEKYHTRTFRGKPGFKTLIKPSQKAQQRQRKKVKDVIHKHRGNAQAALIGELNPVIRGWTRYYRTCAAKKTFNHLDVWLLHSLHQWARYRHSNKVLGWRFRRYWKQRGERWAFTDGKGSLVTYVSTKIERHTKVTATKSVYDGDWLYWGARLSKTPMYPKRKTTLLKRQRSKCHHCRLRFMDGDVLEVHHRNGDK